MSEEVNKMFEAVMFPTRIQEMSSLNPEVHGHRVP
jgi:hypothetical protein